MKIDARLVVHAFNPSYLGGRDRRIKSLRPDQAKVRKNLSQKQNKTKTTKGLGA
jgi:hypothetical protein